MTISPQTLRGHEEPFSVQFSVFLANRIGQLKELMDILLAENINVLGLSVVDSTDWAVIRLVLDDPGKAREKLKARGLPFTESEVLLAELSGPTSMREICQHLLHMEINVHFAYPLIYRTSGNPVMVLHLDDPSVAAQALVRHNFKIIGQEDLGDLW